MSSMLYRSLFSSMSVLQSRLPILMYHRVLPKPDPMRAYEVHKSLFQDQMRWLGSVFRIVPLQQAAEELQGGELPARTLCITFDDGYSDNLTVAAPILRDLGLSATFFLTTAFGEKSIMWNDMLIEAVRHWPEPELDLKAYGGPIIRLGSTAERGASIPAITQVFKYLDPDKRATESRRLYKESGAPEEKLMMGAEEIRQLSEFGMDVGGHTVSHPILSSLSEEQAQREIEQNKEELEKICGQEISIFSYPNGKPGKDYLAVHREMVARAGYKFAVSAAWGTSASDSDMLQLARFTPWDKTRHRFLLRLAQNYFRKPEVVQ